MKARIKRLYQAVVGALLTMLGFNGCKAISNIIEPKCEYGMPHADYTLKGTVKDEKGKPLEGISVKYRRQDQYMEDGWIEYEFTTDANGSVSTSLPTEFPYDPKEQVEIALEDIDGEANGTFAKDTLRKDDFKVDFTEDKESSWYKGSYVVTFDARMKAAK